MINENCPFCNSDRHSEGYCKHNDQLYGFIVCQNCGAKGSEIPHGRDPYIGWNKRHSIHLKTLRYKVLLQRDHSIFVREVDGYAVKNHLGIKFCVRQQPDNSWMCDDFETGLPFGKLHSSKEMCAIKGIDLLFRNLETGHFAAWKTSSMQYASMYF